MFISLPVFLRYFDEKSVQYYIFHTIIYVPWPYVFIVIGTTTTLIANRVIAILMELSKFIETMFVHYIMSCNILNTQSMFLDIGWMREESHFAFRIQVKYNVLANSILLENFVTDAQMDITTFLNANVSYTVLIIVTSHKSKFHSFSKDIIELYSTIICSLLSQTLGL